MPHFRSIILHMAASGLLGNRRRGAILARLGFFLLAMDVSSAQVSSGIQSSGTTTSGSAVVNAYAVRGKVVNANTGAGVPRALVTLASRRVLTDAQGQFEFPGYTQARGAMTVSKPGYGATSDGTQPARTASYPDLTVPVQLFLYPYGLLTGIVSGRDGLPLAGVQARLYLADFDINGLTWVSSAFTQTDSHGEYRFSAAAGRYRVSIGYLAHARDTGEAVLPIAFPSSSSSETLSSFVLASGEEKRIDLRPKSGPANPVTIHVQPADLRNVRFSVTDSAGETFFVSSESQGESGKFRMFLPSGTFLVRGRSDGREAAQEGMTRVSVAGRTGADTVMQLSPLPSLPVEIVMDDAAAASSTTSTTSSVSSPSLRQFNLRLHNVRNLAQGVDGDVPLTGGGDLPFQFRVPPGRYQLQGSQGGTWHVESATYGQTNLLSNELVMAQGSGGAVIRIVADNRTGMLQGTVKLPASVATAWVYLIPRSPSLSVANPVAVVSPGSFTTRVAIGSYDVVALDHQVHMNLRDPEVMARFSPGAKTLEISANTTVTADLDLIQEKGANQ